MTCIKISTLPPNCTENDLHATAGACIHFSYFPGLCTTLLWKHTDTLWLGLLSLTRCSTKG